jgi:hypothetical protein
MVRATDQQKTDRAAVILRQHGAKGLRGENEPTVTPARDEFERAPGPVVADEPVGKGGAGTTGG